MAERTKPSTSGQRISHPILQAIASACPIAVNKFIRCFLLRHHPGHVATRSPFRTCMFYVGSRYLSPRSTRQWRSVVLKIRECGHFPRASFLIAVVIAAQHTVQGLSQIGACSLMSRNNRSSLDTHSSQQPFVRLLASHRRDHVLLPLFVLLFLLDAKSPATHEHAHRKRSTGGSIWHASRPALMRGQHPYLAMV